MTRATTARRARRLVAATPVQGTLALDPGRLRGRPLTAVPSPATDPAPERRRTADVVPFDRARRREIEAWAPRYLQAAVEVAGAHRPAAQLLRWSTPEVHGDLARRAVLVARARLHDVPGTSTHPGRRRDVAAPRRVHERPRVLSTRACAVTGSAVEVSAHVRHGRRSRAVAARFEHREGRWVCTALEFA